jgi:hypothetical protein
MRALPNRLRYASLLLCMLVLTSLHAETQSPEIRNVIIAASENNEMHIINALDSFVFKNSQENLLFLKDLWENNQNKHPELPWKNFQSDLVKTELANVLLQADRNGFHTVNKIVLHKFVLEKVKSPDKIVKGLAAHTLGMAGDDADIKVLVNIVMQEEPGVYEQAALGLIAIDSPAAKNSLRELRKTAISQQAKTFLDEIIQSPPMMPTR